MSMETNAKLLALRETIAKAIKDGNLEKKMDVLKLQAVELELDEPALHKLIEEQKLQVLKQGKTLQIVREKKTLISIICLVIIAVEWLIGLLCSVSFTTITILLIINLLTIIAVLFSVAFWANKKLK